MAAVVADTHVVLWMLLNSSRLSEQARVVLQGAFQSGNSVYMSSISLVEVAYLVEHRKLPESAWQRLQAAVRDSSAGLSVVPPDCRIAEAVRGVSRKEVADMPDRIIAATALFMGLPLVTRDAKIRASSLETIW